ncbi:MAG: o-succinylbenzoate synthase [Nitrospiraceae bacterium]|nr:o-succinylbenzoate synthase [Nitrospiraceae bacterium]
MNTPLIEVFRYDLPLTRPLPLRHVTLDTRSGLIVKISDGPDNAGYGDIAPLPGFSAESLDDAIGAVTEWTRRADAVRVIEGIEAAGRDALPPSVRFGVETATWQFLAPVEHNPGQPGMRRHVPLSALLSGDFETVARDAHALCGSGYRAVKLKVGAQAVEDDIDCARLVRRILGHDIALRLDANRAWDFTTACRFVQGINDLDVEYIEEPLASAGRLWELAVETSVPIALDETVVERIGDPAFPADSTWAGAVILKPTLLGGAHVTTACAASAFKAGLKPVISACFESGVGLIALARLAALATWYDLPVGLGTYDWLAEDVLGVRFQIENGMLDLAEMARCLITLDTSKMTKILHV